MPQFEVFTKRMVPLTKAPYITLQKRGVMSFNQSAYHALGSPEAIELLYDAADRIIGIRAVDPTAEHAYPIRVTNNATSFVVSGTAFVRYYNIPTEVSRRYAGYMEDGALCIDLKTGGTEVTQHRAGATDATEDVEGVDDAGETMNGATETGNGTSLGAMFKDEGALL